MSGTISPAESARMVALLGGARALGLSRAAPSYVALVRGGLPYRALRSVTESLGLSRLDLERALRLNTRTLARRSKQARLTPVESERIVRLARVAARASQVFADREGAADWLRTPNRALGGAPPLELLDTDVGAAQVLEVLGRIDWNLVS